MNRFNMKSRAASVWGSAKNFGSKATLGLTGLVASGAAFAGGGGGSDPAGAITSQLSGLADSVGGIIVLLAAALAVLILWSYVKKSR